MLILSGVDDFYLDANVNSFPYERLSTRPRLEKEAKHNSEMGNPELQ